VLSLLLAGCTQAAPEKQEQDPPVMPDPVPAAGSDGCQAWQGIDPVVPRALAKTVAPLREASAWSRTVDARGGYSHRVDFDGDGNLTWGHDAGSMDFGVSRYGPDGDELWHRAQDPKEHEPDTITTTRSGVSLVAGTAFASDYGQLLVAIDAEGTEMWRQPMPRIGVDQIEPAPGGLTIFEGHSGRAEVTLGGHAMVSDWGTVQGMDVLGALDQNGEFAWTQNFLPGVLDMAVHDQSIFLVGNYGDFEVDFGRGPERGPGVAARFDSITGEHQWSRHFDTGLKAIVPQGDDLLVIGFPGSYSSVSLGGPQLSGTPAARLDAQGCYRGSVLLGDGIGRVDGGDDGSFVVWGLVDGTTRLGDQEFELTGRAWLIARFDPQLQLTHVLTTDCDNTYAAAGPHGRLAVSCLRDVSSGQRLVRRYELFVVE
jgi:hypothetical protein